VKSLKHLITSPILALIVALIPTSYFEFIHSDVLRIIMWLIPALLLLYFVLALRATIIEMMEKIEWKKQLQHSCVYEHVRHDWQLSSSGDFFQRSTYVIKNIGEDSVSYLPEEKGLFFKRLKDNKLSINSLDVNRKISMIKNFFLTNIYPYLDFVKSYNLGWSIKVSPPLKKNETFQFEQIIDAYGTEVDAFLHTGTTAGIPANIPIKEVHFQYLAPPTFRFEIIEPLIVVQFNGTVVKEIPKNIIPPSINKSNNVLTWHLKGLKGQTRYGFRYRIVKEK
jgi:hypothetical protein